MAAFVKGACLALILLVSFPFGQGDVEISITPAEPPKVGEEVTITCTADQEILDILQLVKIIEETEYEISTNDFLKDPFQNTNRYQISLDTIDNKKVASIIIKDVQGLDSGKLECRHTLLDGTRYVSAGELNVLVPPSGVEIMQFNQGDISAVEEDKSVLLKEGEEYGVICRVSVEGSLANPIVSITIGETDVTSMFDMQDEPSTDVEQGLISMQNVLTYTYKTDAPDTANNGQTLTCSATLPQFDPISKSSEIEVHTYPKLECEGAEGMIGDSVSITCQGDMFPALELASASWVRGTDSYFLDLDEPDKDRHHFSVKANEDGTQDFVISLDEIMEVDFGSYKIEVQNSHGPESVDVVLTEVKPTTTTTTTTTTTAPKTEPKETDTPEINSNTGSAKTMAPVYLIGFLTLVLSSWV